MTDAILTTHAVVGDGLVFELRIFRFGDGFGWAATAEDVVYDASNLRSWPNQRLAHEDAVATLERMFA